MVWLYILIFIGDAQMLGAALQYAIEGIDKQRLCWSALLPYCQTWSNQLAITGKVGKIFWQVSHRCVPKIDATAVAWRFAAVRYGSETQGVAVNVTRTCGGLFARYGRSQHFSMVVLGLNSCNFRRRAVVEHQKELTLFVAAFCSRNVAVDLGDALSWL